MEGNDLGALNKTLFDELRRLNNPDLKSDQLKEELSRADAISKVANTVVSNAGLVLKARLAFGDTDGPDEDEPPKMLGAD